MSNILNAFVNIINGDNYQTEIANITSGDNRATNAGEGLEMFIKDAFSNNFNNRGEAWNENFWRAFSYGNIKSNKMPDMVLKNAEAIEVKKRKDRGELQLNSSYPKASLLSTHNITDECRNCEDSEWTEKDIIYILGEVPDSTERLRSLWFIYGTCYAANKEIYQDVLDEIKQVLRDNLRPELNINTDVKELGLIHNIDALRATKLRIRNMWVIKHPSKVFNYLEEGTESAGFSMVAVIPKEKYDAFPQEDREMVEENQQITLLDKRIPNPNNMAHPMDVKLLRFVAPQ